MVFFALLTTFSWALADLFYKKGAVTDDQESHIKTVIMVGLVMGIYGFGYMLIKGVAFNPVFLVTYFPISFMYILSMAIGYCGLRYIELSISSPIQNSSGAVTSILIFIFFAHTLSLLEVSAIVIITFGIVALAAVERNNSDEPLILSENGKKYQQGFSAIVIITFGIVALAAVERNNSDEPLILSENGKKYQQGFIAIIFPILYCVIDGLGTFADAVYLDELSLISEDQALLAYEFTFLICAVIAYIFLKAKKKQFHLLKETNRGAAAVFETAGQFFYVFAMARNAIIVAPLIASYSVFSVLLSRIFLKEKLSQQQYLIVAGVMTGIAMLALSQAM